MEKLSPESLTSSAALQGPRPRAPRYYSLDIWRGAACLLVVVYHSVCQLIPLGDDAASWAVRVFLQCWIGVPMFFVISGYCISATADASRLRPGGHSVRDYFTRRFRRIYPPYWVWLAIVLLLTLVVSAEYFDDWRNRIRGPFELSLDQWIGNLTLTEKWRWHFGDPEQGLVFGPAWTLCYEEQFYFVTGIILLLTPNRFFRAAILVSIGTVLARVVSSRMGFSVAGFFFDGRWLLFALGIAVYYAVNYGQTFFRYAAMGSLAALLLALILAPVHSENKTEYGTGIAFALVILILQPWDAVLANVPLLAPIKFCGTMCYSLYLAHWPTVLLVARWMFLHGVTDPLRTVMITVPLSLIAGVSAGYAFHVLVEKHFLNPPRRATSPTSQGVRDKAPTVVAVDVA
ncbi:MAG TPA: acyltransferase [Pirellulales bacterium]|nr:acyltransferase [Pirellulales bacterium]